MYIFFIYFTFSLRFSDFIFKDRRKVVGRVAAKCHNVALVAISALHKSLRGKQIITLGKQHLKTAI